MKVRDCLVSRGALPEIWILRVGGSKVQPGERCASAAQRCTCAIDMLREYRGEKGGAANDSSSGASAGLCCI